MSAVQRLRLVLVLGLLLIGGLGPLYASIWPAPQCLNELAHQTVKLRGTLKDWPQYKATGMMLKVSIEEYRWQKKWWPSCGQVRLEVTQISSLSPGQKLTFQGTLHPPQNTQVSFDYKSYLARAGIQWVIKSRTIQTLSEPGWLGSFKWWLIKRWQAQLPLDHATLVSGVLMGSEQDLSEPLKTHFKQAGLQHLIVVSGSNVALLLGALGWLGRGLALWGRIGFCLVGLGLYGCLTGFDPPVVRASLFGGVVYLAWQLGRPIDIRNALLFVALLMALFNPLLLNGDASFWLTFAATFGIVLGVPVWIKCTKHWYVPTGLKLLLGVGLSAQLAVLPVLGLFFGTFPWIGLLTNLLAEPMVPIMMLSGLVMTLIPGSNILAWGSAEWWIILADSFGRVPPLSLPLYVSQGASLLWMGAALWALFSPTYERVFWKPARQNLDEWQSLPKDASRHEK